MRRLAQKVQQVNKQRNPTAVDLRDAATDAQRILSLSAVQKKNAIKPHTLKTLVVEVNAGMKFYAAAKKRGVKTLPVYPNAAAVRGCLIKTFRPFVKGGRAGYRFEIYDPDGSGKKHFSFLYELDPMLKTAPNMSKSKAAMVTCSCEFFKYTCEAALNKHFYAEMLHANSETAPVTNPRLKPVLCKHLLRAIQMTMAKGI